MCSIAGPHRGAGRCFQRHQTEPDNTAEYWLYCAESFSSELIHNNKYINHNAGDHLGSSISFALPKHFPKVVCLLPNLNTHNDINNNNNSNNNPVVI